MSYNDDYNRSGREGGYGGNEYSSEGRQEGGNYGGERNDYYNEGGQGGGNQSGNYPNSSGTAYGDGGGYEATNDFSGAMNHAQQHAGSSGDENLFGQALNRLQGNHQQYQNENIDEEDAVRQHQNFYSGGSSGQATAGGIGSAAAMQALKMFTSGGSGGHSGGQSGGHPQNQFVGMAMAEASKLFDSQHAAGNTHGGSSKQEAVTNAAEMAMKMYMKSNMGHGGSSGGGLMSLAQQFLK